jgi:hypothetical protein
MLVKVQPLVVALLEAFSIGQQSRLELTWCLLNVCDLESIDHPQVTATPKLTKYYSFPLSAIHLVFLMLSR